MTILQQVTGGLHDESRRPVPGVNHTMTRSGYPATMPGGRSAPGLACALRCSCCAAAQPQQPPLTEHPARQGPAAESEVRPDRPPTAKTLYSMADILATQGKDTECEFVLRRCVQQYPRFTPAYNSLAELQMRQGRVHEAVAMLSQALEIRPRGPGAAEQPGHVPADPQGVRPGAGAFHTQAGSRAGKREIPGEHGHGPRAAGTPRRVAGPVGAGPSEDKAQHNAEVLRKATREGDRLRHARASPRAGPTGDVSRPSGLSRQILPVDPPGSGGHSPGADRS